ncbi:MAG: hypothetical protein NC411_06130 [Bacteroides sp.]|nr:hypothetical protein [Bacteroides sp.]
MKFDDSDKDYFLHDFSEEGKAADTSPRSESAIRHSDEGADGRRSPTFDFSGGGGPASQAVSKHRKRVRRGIYCFLIIFVILAVTVGIRYFVPYVTESQVTGYVTLVERRGIIFRTFEGEMVSESQLADKGHIYSRDVYFSIPDENLARRLQQYQGTGTPVTLTMKKYYGILPWRGASKNIVVEFK